MGEEGFADRILEGLTEPVLVIDRDYRVVSVNSAYIALCGLDRESAVGQPCHRISHAEESPCILMDSQCPYEKVFNAGEAVRVTHRHVCKDGEERLFEVNAAPIRSPEGAVEYMVEVLRDITEWRAAEDRVRSSEDFVRSVLEGIGEGVVMVGPDFKILRANRVYRERAGLADADIRGRYCYEVSHGKNKPCFETGERCPVAKTLDTGATVREVHIHRGAEGMPSYVEISAYPLKDRSGRITSVIETVNDITRQVRMQDRLKYSEARYRDLYENSPEMMFSVNQEQVVIECNETLLRTLGVGRRDVLGEPFTNILSENAKGQYRSLSQSCESEDICNLELEFRTAAGEAVPVAMTVRKHKIRGREIMNIVARNLTELRRAQEEKRELEARLVQSQKMEALGTLAAGVAHDFNNLLTGLMGYTDLASTQAAGSQRDRSLGRIRELLDVASNLTKQLLVFGKKAETEFRVLSLADFVTDFVETMDRMIGDRVVIRKDFSATPLKILGDRSQLYQLFMNIALNARDSMGEDGGTITITLEQAEREPGEAVPPSGERGNGRYAVVRFADTGCGIPEELIDRIFEPFFTTKQKGARKGTGLGLSVAYSVAKTHGGWIEARNGSDGGATFSVWLPLAADEETAVVEDCSPERARPTTGTILVVDDEDTILEVLQTALADAGFHVLTAAGGQEALDIYAGSTTPIDLVIIDRTMPRFDGIETAKRLRAMDPDLKIVLSSGYAVTDNVSEIDGIVNGFLQKPYRIDSMLELVFKVLA